MKRILRESYDRSAARYDQDFERLQREKYRAMLGERAERLAAVLARERVLDLGCGTGLLAAWLREEAGLLAPRLVGLDLSAAMLARARSRAAAGAGLVQGDLEQLPFRGRCFGAVLAFTALRLVPGVPDAVALAEIRRVLVPGGWFVVTVLARSHDPSFAAALAAAGLHPGTPRRCGQDVGYLCRAG